MADRSFKREPAVRIFAAELSQTKIQIKEESADRFTPTYAFSPTGAKISKVFVCGTLTEVEDIGTEDSQFMRARVVDPTGAFHISAGQYQPEAASTLRGMADKLPAFIAIVGKPNIYKPADGGFYVNIRPETVKTITDKDRESWIAETAERTIERIKALKQAMASANPPPELKQVIETYQPSIDEMKKMVRTAIGKEAPSENAGPRADSAQEQEPPKQEPPKQEQKQPAPTKKEVDAAYHTLKKLGTSFKDGTVGADEFSDKLIQEGLAQPETAKSLIMELLHTGMAYEKGIGRLKAT